jgi:uracil-DNA glycosylase
VPFVGRAGRRLDRAIQFLGFAPDSFGVVNLIKCRPPRNRFDVRAARICRPYLDRQLALLRPEVIVPLGAHALRALDPSAPPVTLAAGRPREGSAIPLFPLLHPAAAMRSRRWAERWDQDLLALRAWWTARTTHTL